MHHVARADAGEVEVVSAAHPPDPHAHRLAALVLVSGRPAEPVQLPQVGEVEGDQGAVDRELAQGRPLDLGVGRGRLAGPSLGTRGRTLAGGGHLQDGPGLSRLWRRSRLRGGLDGGLRRYRRGLGDLGRLDGLQLLDGLSLVDLGPVLLLLLVPALVRRLRHRRQLEPKGRQVQRAHRRAFHRRRHDSHLVGRREARHPDGRPDPKREHRHRQCSNPVHERTCHVFLRRPPSTWPSQVPSPAEHRLARRDDR